MRIAQFHRKFIPRFLALAHDEGWVAEEWEFDFLLKVFPDGCLSVVDDEGRAVAFVTALKHGTSGWIGNLIVAEGQRRQGYGEVLFRKALLSLREAEVQTVWLTASAAGKRLYERYGFQDRDTIVRWIGTGRQRTANRTGHAGPSGTSEAISGIDCRAWGDRRDALLAATVGRGALLQEAAGFVVVQPSGTDWQIGPFAASDQATAERLLESALAVVPAAAKVCMDAPAGNRAAMRIFTHNGMHASGVSRLMYAGAAPAYHPELLYGLATMGSCG